MPRSQRPPSRGARPGPAMPGALQSLGEEGPRLPPCRRRAASIPADAGDGRRPPGIDVVLPTHEQAWLLAAARSLLAPGVRVAVADLSAFERVQSKVAFAGLLDRLGLPQPRWRAVGPASDLADFPFPYWLKAAFSTAGQGVREVVDARTRDEALNALSAEEMPVMAQQPARGQYGQVQGLFDRGRLVAVHTSVRRADGIGGSAAARLSVDHVRPREDIAALGEALSWHGGLTLDYFHEVGSPQYIECNPRTVEPGNAAASGVNIPDLQIRLTLGQELGECPVWGELACVRTGPSHCCWEAPAMVGHVRHYSENSSPQSCAADSMPTASSSSRRCCAIRRAWLPPCSWPLSSLSCPSEHPISLGEQSRVIRLVRRPLPRSSRPR